MFDALISKRCYKPAFSINQALQILKEEKGRHFDAECVDALLKNLEEIMKIYETYKEVEHNVG